MNSVTRAYLGGLGMSNPVTAAYFGRVNQERALDQRWQCAHCGFDLTSKTRVADGERTWCDDGCRELWVRWRRTRAGAEKLAREGRFGPLRLVERMEAEAEETMEQKRGAR